jgi:hypothetical protein
LYFPRPLTRWYYPREGNTLYYPRQTLPLFIDLLFQQIRDARMPMLSCLTADVHWCSPAFGVTRDTISPVTKRRRF